MKYILVASFVLILSCSSQLLKFEEKDFATHGDYEKEIVVIETAPSPTPSPTPNGKEAEASSSSSKESTKLKATPTPKPKPTPKLPKTKRAELYELRPNQKFTILMSYIGMTAGELTFEVRPPAIVNGEKAYNLYIGAKTLKLFEMIYKVNNEVKTYLDYETLLPYSYELNVNESKKVRQARAIFDYKDNEVRYWEKLYSRDGGLKKIEEEWEMPNDAQSAFSAQFYIRTLDFSKSKKHEFWIIHNKENLRTVVEAVREEKVETKFGTFDCYVVKPTLYLKGKEKKMGDVYYWISKDKNRIIAKLEAHIKIGTLKGELHSLVN